MNGQVQGNNRDPLVGLMGQSTINGHFQELCDKLPEGTSTFPCSVPRGIGRRCLWGSRVPSPSANRRGSSSMRPRGFRVGSKVGRGPGHPYIDLVICHIAIEHGDLMVI